MKTAMAFFSISLFGALLLLVSLSWTYTIAALYARRRLPLSRDSFDASPHNRGLVDVVMNVLFYGFVTLGAMELLRFLGQIPDAKDPKTGANLILPIQFYAAGAAQLVAMVMGTAFVCVRARIGVGRFGWDLTHRRDDLLLALYSFGVVIVPVFAIQGLLAQIIDYEHPAITPFKQNKSWEFFTAATLAVVFVGPIAEEFFFRGVLQAWLQRISLLGVKSFSELFAPMPILVAETGADLIAVEENSQLPLPDAENPFAFDTNSSATQKRREIAVATSEVNAPIPQWPVWVTSAIFALLHSGQGAAPAPLFIFSVVLGYLYRKTDRLLPVIAMHMFLNGLSMAGLALSTLMETK